VSDGHGRALPSYDDLLQEVQELRAENGRLRDLLGFEERSSDGHVQAWAPTLLAEPSERPVVDASSSPADKLALFWSLFGARSDVYARRWENTSTGESGWSPATKGRWSKGRPPKDYLPVTDEVFAAHLRGNETVGIYPLLRGDTCALLACDFDKGTWALDALAYLELGRMGGGRNKATGVIDVAMIQSLVRRDDPSLFDAYGLIIVDDCHHLPAVSFSTCMRAARTRRWLGLTATPYRRDRLEALISFQCGPVRDEIKPAAVEGSELVRRELVIHHTETDVTEDEAAHIQDVFRAISQDPPRTEQICQDVHGACAAGRTCLVLTQRTEHIDALVAGLAALSEEALVLRGGLGKRARQAVSDAIAARDPDDGIVLVATGSYLGEGFDWPELDTLFLAFPLAFKGRVVQYVGRLLRAHEGKHHVALHDYVDSRIPVLERMHAKRLPAYTTLGFDAPSTRRRRSATKARAQTGTEPA
jgi:TOTE conflict system, Archaeo-Eukaryotic Primase domain/Type III restriction enzyme, res subunit